MFARLSTVFTIFFFALCVSASVIAPRGAPASQCNTSDLNCCNSTQAASNPLTGLLAGLLGIVLGPITGIVGLNCSPLILGGTSCTAQPVCCTGNNFNGLIVVGCSPVNINL